jgi:hypothetical protein
MRLWWRLRADVPVRRQRQIGNGTIEIACHTLAGMPKLGPANRTLRITIARFVTGRFCCISTSLV